MNLSVLNKRLSLLLIFSISSAGIAASIDSARLKYDNGKLDHALLESEEILNILPNDPAALFLKAQILTENQNISYAIASYQQLIKINPSHIEAYNNLAAIYASKGDLELAREMLERAIEVDPVFSAVHSNLQAVYQDLSKKHYQLALKQTPDDETTQLVSLETSRNKSSVVAMVLEPPVIPEPVLIITDAIPEEQNSTAIEIESAIQNWAKAWSSRDIENYLDAYRKDYSAGGQTTQKWADSRRWNLTNSEFIDIQLSNIKIQADGQRYRAQFVQAYESNLLKEISDKVLVFVLQAGHWKIARENSS